MFRDLSSLDKNPGSLASVLGVSGKAGPLRNALELTVAVLIRILCMTSVGRSEPLRFPTIEVSTPKSPASCCESMF